MSKKINGVNIEDGICLTCDYELKEDETICPNCLDNEEIIIGEF